MKVVAFVPDLMDRSRFPRAADVTFVSSANDLAAASGDADLVIVDLSRNGALEAISAINSDIRRIGFTNHENTPLLEAAVAAGIEALPRSRFFSRITHIVL